MDLRHLEYFLAVVEHGGINRAAAAIHVAQPSLSQAIRKFEKELGTELFHRVGRGIVLSPAGETLVGHARKVLREAENAVTAVRDVGQGRLGRVEIAALSDMSVDPLGIWVGQFRLNHPDVRFRLDERETTSEVIALVTSGQCEIGVLPLETPLEDLVSEILLPQRFFLVCPAGTASLWPETVSLESLSGVPLVLGDRRSATSEYIDEILRRHGVEPRVAVEVPQRGAVVPIVVAGGGVSIQPLRVALDAHRRGAVVRQLDPPMTRQLSVIHRGSLTAASEQFLAAARKMLQQWREAVDEEVEGGAAPLAAAIAAMKVTDKRRSDYNQQQMARMTAFRPDTVSHTSNDL